MCVCVCVCVCVLFVDLFQDDLMCLFSPHQVNHGGVQKAPAQVILHQSHTTEESLWRLRRCRYCQVLSRQSGQVRKLLLTLLSPHQRVCVVGHLLDLHVDLKLGFPFEGGRVKIRVATCPCRTRFAGCDLSVSHQVSHL